MCIRDSYITNEVTELEELMEIKQLIQRQKLERMIKVHKGHGIYTLWAVLCTRSNVLRLMTGSWESGTMIQSRCGTEAIFLDL